MYYYGRRYESCTQTRSLCFCYGGHKITRRFIIAVQAFEYMPKKYLEKYFQIFPNAQKPFSHIHQHNIIVELATTLKELYEANTDGKIRLIHDIESIIEQAFEAGRVLEAVVAKKIAQRNVMWDGRKAAAV